MTKITLATLAQATEQQVFDQVALHLLTQNEQSHAAESSGKQCLYRSVNPSGKTLCCAAGVLISDVEYHYTLEGCDWDSLHSLYEVPIEHLELIARLQQAHDLYDPDHWEARLFGVAKHHGLNADVVTNFKRDE